MSGEVEGAILIVANPSAGGGRGARLAGEIAAILRQRGRAVSCVTTEAPGHGTELAATAVDRGASLVAAIGGDGTVHEVLNGLMRIPRERRPALAVVAAGTGNDYAMELGTTDLDPGAVAASLASGTVQWVGVGEVRGTGTDRCFFGVGIGFAVLAEATALLRRWRPLPGRLSYFAGGVRALLGFRAPEIEVRVDGRTRRSRFMAVHIGLCRTTGGGYCLTPEAGLDSGRLDVATVGLRPRLLALLEWPWISRGRRVHGVEVVGGTRVRVAAGPDLLLHVDGEVRRAPDGVVEAVLLPDELRVLAARRSQSGVAAVP